MADETKDHNPLDDEYMTVAEVATLLRLSKMTVYRLVNSGELKAGRLGSSRAFRIRQRDVQDYLRDAFQDRA